MYIDCCIIQQERIRSRAIKEINNSIIQAHKLELEEMKLSKDIEKDQSDDTRVMELYKAFVNTPVGAYQTPNIPSIAEMTLPGTGGGVLPVTMNGDLPASQLTPEQLRMRMESNPNILVVVKFNQSTGQRCLYNGVINFFDSANFSANQRSRGSSEICRTYGLCIFFRT